MDAQKAKQLLLVITAFANGSKIEFLDRLSDRWVHISEPKWDGDARYYRVKPQSAYRPFANREEVMQAIKDKGSWVQCDNPNWTITILNFTDHAVVLSDNSSFPYADFVTQCSFFDGTPCGVREE